MTKPASVAAVLEAHLLFNGDDSEGYVLLEMRDERKGLILKHVVTKTPQEVVALLHAALTKGEFTAWHNDEIDQDNKDKVREELFPMNTETKH
jgi:hypothetical protein